MKRKRETTLALAKRLVRRLYREYLAATNPHLHSRRARQLITAEHLVVRALHNLEGRKPQETSR